jgi:hypothetical protein
VACQRIEQLRSTRLTAAHSQGTPLKRVQSERYSISYDIMNLYQNTIAQRLHNRSYLVKYMVGYILFIGICAPLPSTSVNYQHVFDTKVDAILLHDELQ